MRHTHNTAGQRAVTLGSPPVITEDTLTTRQGECAITYALIAPYTYAVVCSHGKTAVSGSVPTVLRLLKRKH
jgi:hypothetical protein